MVTPVIGRNSVALKRQKLPVVRKALGREWDSKLELKFVLAGAGSHALSNRASFTQNKEQEGDKKSIREEQLRRSFDRKVREKG